MIGLRGKVSVVTGGSKGIGAAVARRLGTLHASVVVNYRSSETAAMSVVKDIVTAGGDAIAIKADITKEDDVRVLFSKAKGHFRRIDSVVNNAGVFESCRLERITEEHCTRHFALNVYGVVFCCQQAAYHFDDSGGTIVNVGSTSSSRTPAYSTIYNATKAAVDAVTRTLAKELAGRHIRVNSVNPGLVDTEGLRATHFTNYLKRSAHESQLQILEPSRVAEQIIFMASDASAPTTGHILEL